MDDILKRLGVVEATVSDIRARVTGIEAVLPHLATKADVSKLETLISKVETLVAKGETSLSKLETSLVKWIVATGIGAVGLAIGIAKFVF